MTAPKKVIFHYKKRKFGFVEAKYYFAYMSCLDYFVVVNFEQNIVII